jgi:paraquat-inducible protein A
MLILPANIWPVLSMRHMQEQGPKTILGGVVELAESGNWGLSILVFVASIIIPVLKLAVLFSLLVATGLASPRVLPLRTKLHRFVALIGRWSMIDIFAAWMLFSLARFGWFGSVHPGLGALAFCAVVLLTMLASESFDPRIMWDRAGKNPRSVEA